MSWKTIAAPLATLTMLGIVAPPASSSNGSRSEDSAAAKGGRQNMVVGEGETNPRRGPGNHFVIDARGANGQGEAQFDDSGSGSLFRGEVICLRVDRNRATMLIRFTKTTNQPSVYKGGGALIVVEDNGEPKDGDAVDRIRNVRFSASQLPDECPSPNDSDTRKLISGNINPRTPVIGDGDITVHDGDRGSGSPPDAQDPDSLPTGEEPSGEESPPPTGEEPPGDEDPPPTGEEPPGDEDPPPTGEEPPGGEEPPPTGEEPPGDEDPPTDEDDGSEVPGPEAARPTA